jgi:hypothetical protein
LFSVIFNFDFQKKIIFSIIKFDVFTLRFTKNSTRIENDRKRREETTKNLGIDIIPPKNNDEKIVIFNNNPLQKVNANLTTISEEKTSDLPIKSNENNSLSIKNSHKSQINLNKTDDNIELNTISKVVNENKQESTYI